MFVGLCSVDDNHSMEDTHKSENSVMLNLLDSTFWINGQRVQNFNTKNAKIQNPFDNITDIDAQNRLLQNGIQEEVN